MILLWLYYAKLYILVSLIITVLINKATNKIYLAPLIINMISFLLLMIVKENRAFNMYVIYFPVVLSSVILNFTIYILKKIKEIRWQK